MKQAVLLKEGQGCLELAVTEVLEVLFETSTKDEYKEIVENLCSLYGALADSILCYLEKSQVIEMRIINKIAFCVTSSVIWMVNDQDIQEEYLHRLAERFHYIEFFFSLIALNLQSVSQDTFHINFENYKHLLNLSCNAKGK